MFGLTIISMKSLLRMKSEMLQAEHRAAAAQHREILMERDMKEAYLEVNRKMVHIDQLNRQIAQRDEAIFLQNQEIIALSSKLDAFRPVKDSKGRFTKKQLV